MTEQEKNVQEIVDGYKPAVTRTMESMDQAKMLRQALETAGYKEITVTPLEDGAVRVVAEEVAPPEDVLE